jgi:hypothetical protein
LELVLVSVNAVKVIVGQLAPLLLDPHLLPVPSTRFQSTTFLPGC